MVLYAAPTLCPRFSPAGWSFRSRRLELTGAAGFVVAGFSLRGWQGPWCTIYLLQPRSVKLHANGQSDARDRQPPRVPTEQAAIEHDNT